MRRARRLCRPLTPHPALCTLLKPTDGLIVSHIVSPDIRRSLLECGSLLPL
jgi:hypothetical protein